MTAKGQQIAGTIVVIGLALCVAAPLTYGIYDLVKFGSLPDAPTASWWFERFLMRHPIVGICGGFAIGVLAGHFAWWQQAPKEMP
jgi:hypothetical protein